MAQEILEVVPRAQSGKAAARRLRAQGLVPGVVFGRGTAPQPIAVNAREFALRFGRRLHSSALLQLQFPDGQEGPLVMISAVQRDPIRGDLLNVDLHQVSLTEKVQAMVAVALSGEPAGMREGGVLSQLVHEVKVECLPTDIPARITADITHLQVGEALHLGDLQVPAGVELLGHAEDAVALVTRPIAETVEEAAEAAPVEPELVEKKTEEAV